MPPKVENKPSKKSVREKAESSIEDQSFGLKNKNKSKKVQQFIARVEKGVKNSTGLADAAKAKEAKKEAKIVKQLEEEQLRSLLNEGISNQFGKKKTSAQTTASNLGIAEATDEVAKLLEEFSSDDSDDDYQKKRKGPDTYTIDDEPIAVEVFREKTIEDYVEEQRAKLAAEGKKGTPVTAESFAKWRAAKLAKRQADAEARVKAEQSKKKGGKGLSVLSGKELFNYNASLFVDDDGALDQSDETALTAEFNQQREREEVISKEEARIAQVEQERLQEIERIEADERNRKYDDKRRRARDPKHATLMLGSVIVNAVVFMEDEYEDLSFFPEIVFNYTKDTTATAVGDDTAGEPAQAQQFSLDMGNGQDDEEDDNDADQEDEDGSDDADDEGDEEEGNDGEEVDDLRPSEAT